MPSSATILVTDGEHRAALAITRSLGAAGYRVVVASPRRRSLAGASRWAGSRLQTPSPLDDPAGFVDSVRSAVRDHGVSLILPVSDQSILPLLEVRDTLPGAIPLPGLEIWRAVADKAAVLEQAQALGISVPAQHRMDQPGSEHQLPPLRFPVVIKPSRSLARDQSGPLKVAVRHAADAAELRAVLGRLPAAAWPVLVQERIVGPGTGVFLQLRQGELVACFSHRRVLEKPPAGGVSVCSESVPLDPALRQQSHALLSSFGWDGVAMVEYKIDRATGTPFLMEVNGRFWGSLQLAIDSGVNFPLLLVQQALGLSFPPVLTWRTGLQCRWRMGELDHLLARLRRSPRALALAPDAPSLGTTVRHALIPAWGPHQKGEVFRLGDPRPALTELAAWIRGQ